ncbi:hypothetical protein LF41_2921 [Lysobacter dokdonensis DS-58]|uniref:Uncharacterized protein n=1 Tax=Lysobacter dokdonensis DS-58 TaxID=1300345 RepID=A0A0A2WLX3_9GAMM|nr:hypothetical protein [Lysobacter dokdonensis]KGQ19275.1 hypothetical protein LF41_2921 [Lysobacter dokdonensis DS-58]
MLALLLTCAITPTHAEEGLVDSVLRIHCDATHSRLLLTAAPSPADRGSDMAVERIDVGNLIKVSEEDTHGDIRRLGTGTVGRTCGRVSIKISGGFYNSNPQGEMGAASDVPVVDIFDGDEHLAGPLAIGTCATRGRYEVIAECPANWAKRVEVFESQGSVVVYLVHEYEEYRRP